MNKRQRKKYNKKLLNFFKKGLLYFMFLLGKIFEKAQLQQYKPMREMQIGGVVNSDSEGIRLFSLIINESILREEDYDKFKDITNITLTIDNEELKT